MDQSTTIIAAPHDMGQRKPQTSVAMQNILNNGPINPPPSTPPMPPPIAPSVTVTVLGLVPLRQSSSAAASSSVASSNNNHSSSGNNGQNGAHARRHLEVKRFPIVLGRDNLAQWWYHSCSCQNYYCRLHCRPVAQNVGSLSKVMIQIGSVGDVHIVGKNPHLVTIISPGEKAAMTTTTTTTSTTPNRTPADEPPPVLREHDILSIGRRDREPWMRFLVVRSPTHTQTIPLPSATTMDAGPTVLPPPKQQPILSAAPQPVTTSNILERKRKSPGSPPGPNNGTNDTPAGNSSHNPIQNAGQEHEAIMANLNQAATDAVTRGEAAAAAAPSAPPQDPGRERRNKQEKQKRERSESMRGSKKSHANRNSSGNGAPCKAAIRTAEDLYHNGSKSRSRRLRIHLLFPDYERSAQLVRATQRGVPLDTGGAGGGAGGGDNDGLHNHHTARFYSYSANQQFPRAGNFLTNGPALANIDPGTVAVDGATGSLEMAGNTTTADTSDQDASQRDATQDEPEANKAALKASGVSTNLENLSQNYAAALLNMANKETNKKS